MRNIHIDLPSLEEIPELTLVTRQESWNRLTNTSFKDHSHHNSRIYARCPLEHEKKRWEFPLAVRWGPNLLHCLQSNSVFSIKHVRSLDLFDGTPQSPQEHCHKSRRTLLSLQECKIAQCTQINSKWSPIPQHWLQSHLAFHIIHTQVAWLPLDNARDSLRQPSQV